MATLQFGDIEITIGKLEWMSLGNIKFRSYPSKFISAQCLERWQGYTEHLVVNPQWVAEPTVFTDIKHNSHYTTSDIYAFPAFKINSGGSYDGNYYSVWYQITGSDLGTASIAPVGSYVYALARATSNNQLKYEGGFLTNVAGQNHHQFINPQEYGIGLYSYTVDNQEEYAYSTGIAINYDAVVANIRYSNVGVGDVISNFGSSTDSSKILFRDQYGPKWSELLPPEGVAVLSDDEPTSDPDDAPGTYDPYGDDIDYADVPSVSAVNTGLLTQYKCTVAELEAFSTWLWNLPSSITDAIHRIAQNPLDLIVSLQFLPIDTSNVTAANLKIGCNDSGIASNRMNSQYIQTAESILHIDEYYASFIDYAPNTKIMLYLPFIGFRVVDTNDVMAGAIGIKYNIDTVTGDCVAMVKVYSTYTRSVLYTFNGNCSSQAPLNGRDFSQIFSACLGAVKQTVGAINSPSLNSALDEVSALTDVVQAFNNVDRGGAISGNAGLLTGYTPYLLFIRPSASIPQNYNHYYGRPSNMTRKLSSLSGFTSVKEVITDGFGNATKEEIDEINRLLKEGVYI